MKTKLTLLALLTCLAVYAASGIRWTWPTQNNAPILQINHDGQILQLGLRDDGVVVWREISNTTNSPAEAQPYVTNLWVTNWQNFIIVTNTPTPLRFTPNGIGYENNTTPLAK